MDTINYQIIYGKNVKELLENVQINIEKGFFPIGSLVFVDNCTNNDDKTFIDRGFYQPMIKEDVHEFIKDYIE